MTMGWKRFVIEHARPLLYMAGVSDLRPLVCCANRDEYRAFVERSASLLRHVRSTERRLIVAKEQFAIFGWCIVCEAPARFLVDYSFAANSSEPNWRERL